MRAGVVVHYLGLLLLFLAAVMLIPLGISVLDREVDQLALLTSVLVTGLCGASMWFWTRKQPGHMVRRESFLVVALGWALASAFGAIPYMLAGTFTSYIDAYFETMPGFTTTGSSVLANIEAQPHGILFWRDFTQWLGGMGIIALFIGVAATLGNIGPGLAKLGPTLNFSGMPDAAKIIFIFDMYVGRLELWTVLILFRPAFWREP
jgi:trk system potassium uptake protein